MAAVLTTALAAAMVGPVTTASASTGAVRSQDSTNLVVNGSFEDPSTWQTNAVDEYPGGSTGITGWTVGGDSVDVTGSGYWTAQDGDQSVDLSGSAPGSVSQTVATTPGSVYTLTWYMAGNTNCGLQTKTMNVSWDGSLVYAPTFDTNGFDNQNMGWTEEQIEVAATGSSAVVEFADATPDNSQCGSVLDDVSLTTAVLASPVFVRDSPSLQALAGSPYSASFYASGVPVYSLVGAPSWLSVNAEGAVVGTPPTGTTSFTYTVSADNADGHATAGPYTVEVQSPAAITGTVVDGGIAANPVVGSTVTACVTGGSECQETSTAADGSYSVNAPAGSSVVVTAFPLPNSGDATTSTEPATLPAAGLQNETISLDGVAPLPSGLLINGTSAPTVYWANPSTATLTGCANGLATVSVTGVDTSTGELSSNLAVLTETPAGSGDYTGIIPPQEPVHGPVDVSGSVQCPTFSTVFPYLGPPAGGTEVTLTGSGFTGATAVDFGSVPAQSFTVLSDDAIQAVAPPGTGTVSATVYDGAAPGGTAVGDYTYQAVTSISPASGPAGGDTWVVIDGSGLLAASNVLFGSTSAQEYVALSDTQIEALSPPGTGTQDITVLADDSTTPTTTADQFTYTAGDAAAAHTPPLAVRSSGHTAPVLLHASPPAPSASATRAGAPASPRVPGTARPALSLTGIGNAITAYIYESGADIVSDSGAVGTLQNQITQLINNLPRTCKTSRANDKGTIMVTIGPLLDVLAKRAAPSVIAREALFFITKGPYGWAAGTVIILLTPILIRLLFEKIADSLVEAGLNAALGDCPDNTPPPPPLLPPPLPVPGSDPHCVPAVAKCSGTPDAFVDPSGTVLDTNGNPVSGATVTILRGDTAAGPFSPLSPADPGIEPNVNPQTTADDGVFHWDVTAGWYEIQAQAADCTDPADPGNQTATIGPYPVPPPQVGLTITLACTGEAPPPVPTVSSLSQDTGPAAGGTVLTVLGTGFTPASTAAFGSTAAAVTYLSPEALTVTAPPGSGLADVTVRNAGTSSATSSADQFFYGSVPTVSGLSAATGPSAGGTVVTISGTGFTGATGVAFGDLPATAFTVVSDTQIQATAPAANPGTVDVQVITPAGASASAASDQFTYGNVPPAFTADSPPTTGMTGQSYTYTYAESGSPAPTFSVGSGSLPPGLSLDPASGLLSGTPTAAGAYTFTVVAYNGAGASVQSPATTITVAGPSGPAIDQQATGTGTTTVTTHLSTTAPGDLIVAFVSGDGPSGATQKAKVTGGGLTWTLSQRTDNGYGTAEIWTARASGTLSNAAITSALAQTGYGEALTVVAFSNAPGTGHTAGAWAAKGAPTASLTTSAAGSRVFAVGNDWTASAPRTVGANQTLLTQSTDARGDTYWVQYLTAPVPIAGTSVTINDTAPTQDRWNLAVVEID